MKKGFIQISIAEILAIFILVAIISVSTLIDDISNFKKEEFGNMEDKKTELIDIVPRNKLVTNSEENTPDGATSTSPGTENDDDTKETSGEKNEESAHIKVSTEKKEEVTPINQNEEDKTKPTAEQEEEETTQAKSNENNKTNLSTSEINQKYREAVVNFFCVSENNSINSITGSGILISPNGVVLTNAHLAQYLLLDEFVDCTLRVGSPAQNTYTVELLYVSPSWVEENHFTITQENPVGTGENDFALLRITGRTNPDKALPEVFPFVPLELNTETVKRDDEILIVAYPAGFLGSSLIQSSLNILSTIAEVDDLFTFENGTLDLLSIRGTILAQSGASGGAVANQEGNLIGIVVTASQQESTGQRELRAITVSHINRSLAEDFGTNILSFIIGDIESRARQFQDLIAPGLKLLLLQAITQ